MTIITICTWDIFGGGKLMNGELFAKTFLTNIHRYTENVFGICTDCSLFAKFFLANNFYLYGLPKFSPTKYFLCTVYCKLFEVEKFRGFHRLISTVKLFQ